MSFERVSFYVCIQPGGSPTSLCLSLLPLKAGARRLSGLLVTGAQTLFNPISAVQLWPSFIASVTQPKPGGGMHSSGGNVKRMKTLARSRRRPTPSSTPASCAACCACSRQAAQKSTGRTTMGIMGHRARYNIFAVILVSSMAHSSDAGTYSEFEREYAQKDTRSKRPQRLADAHP